MNVSPYNLKRYLGIDQDEGMSKLAFYNHANWQDHLRLTYAHEETGGFDKGTVMLISEPYSLSKGGMAEISALCTDYKLAVIIDSHSKHNPGNCCRVMLWREKTT